MGTRRIKKKNKNDRTLRSVTSRDGQHCISFKQDWIYKNADKLSDLVYDLREVWSYALNSKMDYGKKRLTRYEALWDLYDERINHEGREAEAIKAIEALGFDMTKMIQSIPQNYKLKLFIDKWGKSGNHWNVKERIWLVDRGLMMFFETTILSSRGGHRNNSGKAVYDLTPKQLHEVYDAFISYMESMKESQKYGLTQSDIHNYLRDEVGYELKRHTTAEQREAVG